MRCAVGFGTGTKGLQPGEQLRPYERPVVLEWHERRVNKRRKKGPARVERVEEGSDETERIPTNPDEIKRSENIESKNTSGSSRGLNEIQRKGSSISGFEQGAMLNSFKRQYISMKRK